MTGYTSANGNLTRDETGRQFVYDAWNRLVAVKDSGGATLKSYAYDGQHRRISETAGGTTTDLYYSDTWQVLEERVASGGTSVPRVQYVWSPVYVDALVLRDRDTNGDGTLDERLWVVQDANYNVTALFDNAGNVVERYAYDPFGQVTVLDAGWNVLASSAFGWLYLHQGGRFDATSGLYHFRHRDYSPTLGRWTSLDPIQYEAGDVNLYRALGNGPTNRLDPSGMDWLDWVQGGLDVIGVFDPTPLSDGVNALISAGRGDWTGAGLSAISMIPYAGDVIGKGGKVVRYGKKAVDAIEGAKPAAKQLVAPKGLLNEGARATELADEALLNKLRVRGFTIDQSAEIQRYLDYRKANAATFLEKDLLLRPDARKIEVLEEYLHNVQKDIGLMNKMTPAQMEVHVKEFMLRHKKMLGISEADAQWLKNWLDKAKGQ